MLRAWCFAVTLSACGLSACTTYLQTGRPTDTKVSTGVSYQLPEVLYDVEIKRTLSACPDLPQPKSGQQVEFDVTASAVPRTVAGETIVIDYTALARRTKTTDFSIELYPSGVLKSVNTSIDDRTANIATEAFKAAVSVGKIAIGLPPSITANLQTQSQLAGSAGQTEIIDAYLVCTADAAKTLKDLPELRKRARNDEAALKKAKKDVADFDAAHKEATRSPNDTKTAATYAGTQRKAQEEFDASTKAVTDSVAAITVVSRLVFVPDQGVSGVESSVADARAEKTKPEQLIEVLAQVTSQSSSTDKSPAGTNGRSTTHAQSLWLPYTFRTESDLGAALARSAERVKAKDKSAATGAPSSEAGSGVKKEARSVEIEDLLKADVQIASAPSAKGGGAATAAGLGDAGACGTSESWNCGILYRTVAQGRVRVCQAMSGADLPDAQQCLDLLPGDHTVLFNDERAIPQMGGLASLGLKNGVFSSNELKATFGETGNLITFSYKKPVAEGEVLGQTVNSGLDAATSLITYSKGKQLRELQEEKAVNDARAAVRSSEVTLRGPQPSEVTRLQNEKALIDAQREKIEAQIELRKKQQELDGLDAGQN